MQFCKSCGAGLGPGRFCTNCGAPVDTPSGTQESAAEKTSVRLPAVQPDASTGARFPLYAAPPEEQAPPPATPPPLFADEVPTRSPEQGTRPTPQATPPASYAATPAGSSYDEIPPWQPPAEPADAGGSHRSEEPGRKRSPFVWILPLLLVLLLGVGIGVWLGNRDSSDDAKGSDNPSQSQDAGGDETTQPSDPESSDPGQDPSDPAGDPADAVDLSDQAKASGPKPVKPGTSLSGETVPYPPSNMLDGDPTTAYRIAGDASGETITFTLPEETTIHEVGLINGYAKTGKSGNRTVDWYAKNRRITEVEWSFDDGTTVTQKLRDSTDLQVTAVDGAVTGKVTLRIVSVSPPGKGDLSKNVTAISSVMLRGNSD